MQFWIEPGPKLIARGIHAIEGIYPSSPDDSRLRIAVFAEPGEEQTELESEVLNEVLHLAYARIREDPREGEDNLPTFQIRVEDYHVCEPKGIPPCHDKGASPSSSKGPGNEEVNFTISEESKADERSPTTDERQNMEYEVVPGPLSASLGIRDIEIALPADPEDPRLSVNIITDQGERSSEIEPHVLDEILHIAYEKMMEVARERGEFQPRAHDDSSDEEVIVNILDQNGQCMCNQCDHPAQAEQHSDEEAPSSESCHNAGIDMLSTEGLSDGENSPNFLSDDDSEEIEEEEDRRTNRVPPPRKVLARIEIRPTPSLME